MDEGREDSSVGFPMKLRGATGALLVAVAMLLLTAVAFGGCSSASPSSVAAYCHTFYQQGTQLRNQWQSVDNNMNQDPLEGIVTVIAVPGQLASFFGQLEAAAPSSIEPEVAQIQQAFQNEVNDAGQNVTDPIAGLIGGLASSIETAPAWTAVNNWTEANCGPPPGTKLAQRIGEFMSSPLALHAEVVDQVTIGSPVHREAKGSGSRPKRPRPLDHYLPLWAIDIAEDVIHAVIAFILLAIAVIVLWDSATSAIHAHPFFPGGVISAINDVLFVIIILEILRTVTAHFRNGGIQIGPFLVIGIISAVRHILTISASLTLEGEGTTLHFNHSMVELALNGGLVIVLVAGLVLLHNIGDPTISTRSSLAYVSKKRHHAIEEAGTSAQQVSVTPNSRTRS